MSAVGKADFLVDGDWNALCYECGRKFKASSMRRHWQGYYVCETHWEPRQPQDFVRSVPDVQTPPWTQPPPADHFATAILEVPWTAGGSDVTEIVIDTGDGDGDGGTTVVLIVDDEEVDTAIIPDGDSKVIVNIPDGVIVDAITISTKLIGKTVIINNGGTVLSVPTIPKGVTVEWRGSPYPPPRLIFYVQPSNTGVSESIVPSIQVAAVGNLDIIVPSFTDEVILEIGNNAGDPILGELSGTLAKFAVDGIATFDDISIDQAGDAYTLLAGYGNQTKKESASFNVEGFTIYIDSSTSRLVFAEAILQLPGVDLYVPHDYRIICSEVVVNLQLGSFVPGSNFTIVNLGRIVGLGGNAVTSDNDDPTITALGGDAIVIGDPGYTVHIDNSAGFIGGGGGGGGLGGQLTVASVSGAVGTSLSGQIEYWEGYWGFSGGGGGAGDDGTALGSPGTYAQGSAGKFRPLAAPVHIIGIAADEVGEGVSIQDEIGTVSDGAYSVSITQLPTSGADGTTDGPGAGGLGGQGNGTDIVYASGNGGAGGDFGESGQTGSAAVGSGTTVDAQSPTVGGPPGNAILYEQTTILTISTDHGVGTAFFKGAVTPWDPEA